MSRPAGAALAARAAAWCLPGSDAAPPTRPLDRDLWPAVLAVVRHQRITGPLAWAIDEAWWPATDEQATQAAEAHRAAMATCLHLERRLLSVAEVLEGARVRWCVLKGPATAHLDEADPSRRAFGDLDILVHGDDLARVYDLLAGLGGDRRYPTAGAGFDRRFAKGACHRLPDGVEVDVHRTLALGPYGLTIDPADLLCSTEPFVLAGRTLQAPDRIGRFLHACTHAALGQHPSRLTALRDVALTAPQRPTEARSALARAQAWQIEAVVATALVDASRVLRWSDPGPLTTWASRLRPRRRDRRWLSAYRGPGASSTARTLLAVEALPDGASRLAYASAVVRTGLATRAAARHAPVRQRPRR